MKKVIVCVTLAALILAGCKSMNNTQKGTAIGAGAGAAAGAIIGKGSAWGVLIGAAIGGSGGYLIGNKMDKQAKELKQAVPDAQVERVAEGINVTFNSALLFKINKSDLSDSAKASLDKVAVVFNDYPETNLLVEGHTDDTGPADYNMTLSEARAQTVANYLQSRGVAPGRFTVKWYGETQPKYPNTSDSNRTLNRRVELAVIANDEMKKKAQTGQLDSTGTKQ
jgi:outer membrane protein OmpA-like peptidoglycan-associated protein